MLHKLRTAFWQYWTYDTNNDPLALSLPKSQSPARTMQLSTSSQKCLHTNASQLLCGRMCSTEIPNLFLL